MAKKEPQKEIKLVDFLEKYRDAITARVIQEYPPIYVPSDRDGTKDKVNALSRKPYVPQWDSVNALTKVLSQGRNAICVGEMGVGKTLIGITTAYVAGCNKVLVWCPPHLVRKWEREIKATVPGAEVVHLKKVGDIQKLMKLHPQSGNGTFNGNLFAIVSRERAKLSYRWKPAVMRRLYKNTEVTIGIELTDDQKAKMPLEERVKYIPTGTIFKCPDCGVSIVDDDGLPLAEEDLKKRRQKCKQCGSTLWQADKDGHRRYAIAEYIKRHHRGYFDLFIIDEAHEAKARGTAQGYAAGMLASACGRTLTLVGTLFGGYSSNLFYLLYRLTTDFRDDFRHGEETKWISMYGILETIKKTRDGGYDDNFTSRGRKYSKITKEKPGISPVILPKYLLDKTVFVRLSDLGIALPRYDEFIASVEMTAEQTEIYQQFRKDLRSALVDALRRGDRSLLSKYLQSLLTWPDRSYVEERVKDRGGNCVAHAPALERDTIYPKQKKLVDLCKANVAKGRRVLVYCSHTDTKDITDRLADLLRAEGLRTVILKSSAVPAEKREDWIVQRVKEGVDVLITNPKCVQTGLDLVDFPTIVFQEIEYSVFVLRQASRRSWRIGQHKDVEVYYFVYENTIQVEGLKLIATKYKASLGIEGEFLDDGLAVYNTSCDADLYYDLARSIVGEIEIGGSAEEMWRDATRREMEIDKDSLFLSKDVQERMVKPVPVPPARREEKEMQVIPIAAPCSAPPAHFQSKIDIEELRKLKAEAQKPKRVRKGHTNQIPLFQFQ